MEGNLKADALTDERLASDSASHIAQMVLTGRQTAQDTAQEALERLQRLAPLNVMTYLAEEAAMAAARRVDVEIRLGNRALPLAGVPFVIKDNIATAHMPTSGGSLQLCRYFPKRNAACVELLIAAGAIPVGKANLHELAFGVTSVNAGFGPVRNPHDAARVAGGSSGGTAVAVATAAVPIGLGTDTGGSIRIPAAFCGVYGFRPSTRRYPSDGLMTLSSTRDALGTMARSLEDLRLLDEVLTGQRLPVPPVPISGLRIGLPRRPFFEDLEPGVWATVEQVIKQLKAAGATLVEVDASPIARLAQETDFPIAAYEGRRAWREFCTTKLKISLREFAAGIRSADVRRIFEFLSSPKMFSEADYELAMTQREHIIYCYDDLFVRQGLACLILPTTPCEPPLVSASRHDLPEAESAALFARLIRQTNPATLAGMPSLSLPIGFSPVTNLPVGLLCEGPVASDQSLFALAAAIDQLIS